jgi:hypothetical protein
VMAQENEEMVREGERRSVAVERTGLTKKRPGPGLGRSEPLPTL